MMIKSIEIRYSERCGYCVEVNGEPILECMSKDEVEDLTVKDIVDLYKKGISEEF